MWPNECKSDIYSPFSQGCGFGLDIGADQSTELIGQRHWKVIFTRPTCPRNRWTKEKVPSYHYSFSFESFVNDSLIFPKFLSVFIGSPHDTFFFSLMRCCIGGNKSTSIFLLLLHFNIFWWEVCFIGYIILNKIYPTLVIVLQNCTLMIYGCSTMFISSRPNRVYLLFGAEQVE